GDLQFVEGLVAALVHPRRLTGGADEHSGKHIGQARVVLPVGDQAADQVGAAQQWAVRRGGAPQGDVVAAAGAGVAAVEHEFFRPQAGPVGQVVEVDGVVHQFVPVAGGVDIDLDHPGVGGHQQLLDTAVPGGLVALHHHRHRQLGGGFLDQANQVD